MKVPELVQLIEDGKLDRHLHALSQAITYRRRLLSDREARRNLETMTHGTRVRLKDIRPKYLNGKLGTVRDPRQTPGTNIRLRGSSLLVELDVPARRYGKYVGVPGNCLEKEMT